LETVSFNRYEPGAYRVNGLLAPKIHLTKIGDKRMTVIEYTMIMMLIMIFACVIVSAVWLIFSFFKVILENSALKRLLKPEAKTWRNN
jgi:hypothetical protein